MRPPRGVKIDGYRRAGDKIVMDITVARWRVYWEVVKLIPRMRVRVRRSR